MGLHDYFAQQGKHAFRIGQQRILRRQKWLFSADIALHQHFAKNQDRNIITQQGDKAVVGYDKPARNYLLI